MSDVRVASKARLREPLSFKFADTHRLYVDQLEGRLADLQDFVEMFAAPSEEPRRGRSSASGHHMALSTHVHHKVHTSVYGKQRKVRVRRPAPRRLRISSIRYNSPLEIIVEIPFPLIVTGGLGGAVGSGIALLKFWERFTKARVVHSQGNAAVSKARFEEATWDALREQLNIQTDLSELPKEQQLQIKRAMKFVTRLEDIKVIEK